MHLAPGTRLGAYEVVAPLGAGGMGEVYRARDLRLGRDVALKVLRADVAAHPDRLARFEREARTVAALNHPNIVTLFSVEDEAEARFLTMELVEGQALSDLVTPGGLPLARILELAIPLADALAAAHERGVIHRDLKPGNVMVTRDGRVKVLDFGLAKLADRAVAVGEHTVGALESTSGLVLGTIPYMAPEQLRGEEVDARCDLFALGILLYELAAGRRPFGGATSVDVTSAILRDAPEPLTRVRGDLPIEFSRVVGACLAKSPAARTASALEVSNALRRLRRLAEHGLEAVPAAPDRVASIAVLPFVNRSADADDEYFSDGLADELLNVLAKIQGLRVVARTSSFAFKRRPVTVAEIGAALQVETVLEGSVRKAGERVRISVQLVRVSDSSHLWSETYDRQLDDIFAVQDDIAHSVVKELRTALLGAAADSDASGQAKADVAQAAKGRGIHPEAHRLYLLGRHLIERYTIGDATRAIEYLTQAVALDPGFATAWKELGRAHMVTATYNWVPAAVAYGHARAAAERALALAPDHAEAHSLMGWIRMYSDQDLPAAEASFARALELAPRNPAALNGAGVLARMRGRLDASIDLYRRAILADPLGTGAYNNLGNVLSMAGRFVEAETAFRKALELAPQRFSSHAGLADALLGQGRLDEALAAAQREPIEFWRLYVTTLVRQARGDAAEADAGLRELIASYADEWAFQIAEVHATRGDADAAFAWLERAHAQHDGGLHEMAFAPLLRPLHGDARWEPTLRRFGLAG